MREPIPRFRRSRTYTPEEYERALRMMAEFILRSDGASEQGVSEYLDALVQRYLNMAAGEEKPFLGSIFVGREELSR